MKSPRKKRKRNYGELMSSLLVVELAWLKKQGLSLKERKAICGIK